MTDKMTDKSVLIDYQKLGSLCEIDGLKSNHNPMTSQEAHDAFLKEYPAVFPTRAIKDCAAMRRLKLIQKRTAPKSNAPSTANTLVGQRTLSEKQSSNEFKKPEEEKFTHNIRDYMSNLHKQKKQVDGQSKKMDNLKTLRRILKKLPFERTTEENESLLNALKSFPDVGEQMEENVLREICMVTQMDLWRDPDITVFGNLAFYMVLKGSVRPVGKVYLRKVNDIKTRIPSPTPEDEEEMRENKLFPGDCFGTLEKTDGHDVNSRILSAVTTEPNCELLKITVSDYARVTQQIISRDRAEKIKLLQSSGAYKFWTRQPLQRVADLFQWVTFPENAVIATENTCAQFIAFIKSGDCHILRHVKAKENQKNGKQIRRRRQVVVGKLSAPESFGETSVLAKEPMSFSIVTATECVLAIIDPIRLNELDDITKQLLQQSSSTAYMDLKEADIQDEFIQQELAREWNEYKQSVVMDVINDRGLKPGTGAYAK